jgi:hypothetical protein
MVVCVIKLGETDRSYVDIRIYRYFRPDSSLGKFMLYLVITKGVRRGGVHPKAYVDPYLPILPVFKGPPKAIDMRDHLRYHSGSS